jgi:hypothetical protein
MTIKNFENLLDRFGSDLDSWPANESGGARELISSSLQARIAYNRLVKLEAGIRATRPVIEASRAEGVVRRALLEIAAREAQPPLLDRLWLAITAPVPRVAFAVTLAIAGFGIGMLVSGSYNTRATADIPVMMASAEDALY